MATAASATDNPVAVIRQNLAVMAPELKAALPKHVDEEKFRRVAMTAIQQNPDLQNADRRSLFGAIVRLAQDGLLPDGREAALVLFGGKAQAMPMIAGVLKKIRQSGEVSKVSAQVVYSNDEFVISYGFDEDVKHVPPALNQPRGEPIGAYATAVLKDGSRLLEVMSLEEIEKVRNVSRAKNNGPWTQWWSEMARKTVMRRLAKRLPMSTDLEDQFFSRDVTLDADARALRQVEEPRSAPPQLTRLDAIEASIEPDPPEESPEIERQAEEIEAEIEQPGFTLADEIEKGADEHPGKAKADSIIAEINADAVNAEMDVKAILARHAGAMAAMLDEDAVRVEVAADKKRNAIRAARQTEGAE